MEGRRSEGLELKRDDSVALACMLIPYKMSSHGSAKKGHANWSLRVSPHPRIGMGPLARLIYHTVKASWAQPATSLRTLIHGSKKTIQFRYAYSFWMIRAQLKRQQWSDMKADAFFPCHIWSKNKGSWARVIGVVFVFSSFSYEWKFLELTKLRGR